MLTPIITEGIKNIIFDLGNVIINLDINATEKALNALYETNEAESILSGLERANVFIDYEIGAMSTETFIDELIKKAKPDVSREMIASAWNAMLLDIPKERFQLLAEAMKNYQTFCLSNTNELHIQFINNYLKREFDLDDLQPFFHQVYLSHEMGLRKPNPSIFQELLNNHHLESQDCLFIDDTVGHLEGAKSIGINTYHLPAEIDLEKVLSFN